MVHTSVQEGVYSLLQNIGQEDILKEYKEFYLRRSLTIYDYRDLQKGILTTKVQNYLEKTLEYYLDKYLRKYICSLTNIDKHFLQKVLEENFSNFYIGVSDEGDITGFPIQKDYIHILSTTIQEKIHLYYKDIIGLHYEKGVKEIQVGEKTFYDFEKLLTSLKKHTKVNIHILKKTDEENKSYKSLNKQIEEIILEQEIYEKELMQHKSLKMKKRKYNERYSQSFHKLIRSEIMNEFCEHLSENPEKQIIFKQFLEFLKSRIKKLGDVENYLSFGEYIEDSFYPNNKALDNYYGEKMKHFLQNYKNFKSSMLEKNINIEPFCKKSPNLKLNSCLKNISPFTKQFYNNKEVIHIMIQIELPFIKDTNAYLGLKENKSVKIIKRTYEENMDMPCTSSYEL
tara:strand:- start:236 stop:1429 length:1194 start_codon:yes stop_codon:yes gene_type:complete